MKTMTTIRTARFSLLALLAMAVTFVTAAPASADDMSELKERFKQRAGELLSLRNSGVVGETMTGWVEVVKGGNKAAADLVAAENTDRKALYAAIAVKQKITPEIVAERNALRIFDGASPDHLFKTKAGVWVKKKDANIEGR